MRVRTRSRAVLLAGAVLAAGVGPVSAAALLPSATSAKAGIESALAAQLAAASPTQVIEALVGGTDVAAATKAVKAAGLTPAVSFDRVGFVGVKGTAAALKKVAAQPGVTYLQGNRALRPTMDSAARATRVTDGEAAFTGADGGELDGTGVGIAVVDSGMAGDHPMYMDDNGVTRLLNIKQACVNLIDCASKVGDEQDEYFVDATGLDTDITALGGHGTHVTGIAGGREVTASNGAKVRGVARNASIYGIGAGAGLFTINAAASLNWVLEHHAAPCEPFLLVRVAGGCAPIRVVNNSYGSPGEYSPNDIFAKIGEQLVREGVVVVWAAGNGDDVTEANPRPNDGTVNLANPPGQSSLPGILMVANYDDGGNGSRNGKLNDTSSRGFKGRPETYPDFAAPGTDILSACRLYLPICSLGLYEDPNYGEISGTSMAAPHVAGIVALLLQAYPDLTPAQVEDVLEDTAHKFGDPTTYEADVASPQAPDSGKARNADDTTSFDKGHGLVDLAAALYKLSGRVDPGEADSCASTEATDLEGDAAAFTGIGPKVGPGLPTSDVDIVAARVPQIGDDLRFTVEVADLPEIPNSRGDAVRSFFNAGGRSYILDLNRELGQSGTFETTAVLSTPDPADETGLTNIVLGRYGATFDAAADVAYADLPAELVGASQGDEIGGLRVLWRRSGEAVALPADELVGRCPLLVG